MEVYGASFFGQVKSRNVEKGIADRNKVVLNIFFKISKLSAGFQKRL